VLLVVLALRGVAAVLVLTTLVGGIPRVVQGALAVTIGVWSAVLVATTAATAATATPTWAFAFQELAIGAALGVMGAMPLLAAAAAGRLVDLAATGRAQGAYSTLFGVLAAAVFVGIDGHVAFMRAIVESHVTTTALTATQTNVVLVLAKLIPAAVRLAIPWVVTAAVVQLAVGVGTRVAGRTSAFLPAAAAVPAAIVMMTASLVATLAIAFAAFVRGAL
jgi:flagellar biosynthesis protein FliR